MFSTATHIRYKRNTKLITNLKLTTNQRASWYIATAQDNFCQTSLRFTNLIYFWQLKNLLREAEVIPMVFRWSGYEMQEWLKKNNKIKYNTLGALVMGLTQSSPLLGRLLSLFSKESPSVFCLARYRFCMLKQWATMCIITRTIIE